jgi:Uma2 family endonuclease
LEFWTRFKPDASSDPEFVKEWIQTRSDDLQRRVNYARQQMGIEPVFVRDQDRQAYEWTKKNANDPRAAQIRQKLGLQ